jgi:oxygen-dependent protoporphyrinogen oxidase
LKRNIVLVGGGITGLAAAYQLSKSGVQATLIERQPRLGGVVQTEVAEGCVIEAGPDSFLAAKPAAMELIRELGLESEVIGSNDHQRVTYIKRGGRLVPMPDGLMMMVPTRIAPMLFSPLLSISTKLRMGLEYFRKPRAVSRDRSVTEFVTEHYGTEAVDYLTEPLLSGVYGGDPDELSIASVLPPFVELERKYGSLTRGVLARLRAPSETGGPLFRTLKQGLGHLTRELEARIRPKIEILRGEAVTCEGIGENFRLRVDGDWIETRRLVLCCPANLAGNILQPVDGTLAATLSQVKYNSSMTMALIYRQQDISHPLNGFGFLIPRRERRRLVACTWVGRKFNHRAPDGLVFLRCFLGGASLGETDETLLKEVSGELRELMGFEARPLFHRIHRWPASMAQYTVGHQHRLEIIRERLHAIPGLHLAGNGYEGIGIPDCIRTGRKAANDCLGGRSPLSLQ